MKKVTLLLTLICLSANNCFAQYNVGIGNGFSFDSFNQLSDLNGFAIFSVGIGQGHAQSSTTVELIPNVWKGTTSTNWSTASNWHYQYVPASNADIYFYSTPTNHAYLDQNRTVGSINNAQPNFSLHTNGFKLTLTDSIKQSNDATIDARSSGSTVEFAGLANQLIPANTFTNNEVNTLIINNSADVNLAGEMRVLNTITAISGRLNTVANLGTITYAGTAAQTIESGLFTSDIVYNLVADNANGVIQNSDFTIQNNFTINAAKFYQINPNKCLTVNGTVTNNAGANGLVIKAASNESNGTFIYPQNQTVNATVEFYSKAWWNKTDPEPTNRYKWQFFGSPVSSITAGPTFDGAYVRKHNEAGTGAGRSNEPVKRWLQLVNESEIIPFAGYEIVQEAPVTYSIKGTLVNSDFASGQLNYTSGAENPGMYIYANPYTASIDIANFRNADFGSETEHTIYIYNTGSLKDWTTANNLTGSSPGQYIATPIQHANYPELGLPRYIPSMQAFLIRKLNFDTNNLTNFTFNIPYSVVKAKNTLQLRAKQATQTHTNIEVNGSRFSDKVWLLTQNECSKDFDNGWDAQKLSGSILTPQLMIREKAVDFQINTVNDINDTYLAFQAGEDENYTLTFNHSNTSELYPKIYLIDIQENKTTDISNTGSSYSFSQKPTNTAETRFKIVTQLDNSTAITETKQATTIFVYNKNIVVDARNTNGGDLNIYDTNGKTLFTRKIQSTGIETIETNLQKGVYIVKFTSTQGVRIINAVIN